MAASTNAGDLPLAPREMGDADLPVVAAQNVVHVEENGQIIGSLRPPLEPAEILARLQTERGGAISPKRRAMDRRIFETYVETQLAQRLNKATSSSWTICPLTKARRRESHRTSGALICFCRPTSRRNPIETAIRKTQGASARQGRPHHRRPLEGDRPNLRSLPTRRMQKLLRRRRIRIQGRRRLDQRSLRKRKV